MRSLMTGLVLVLATNPCGRALGGEEAILQSGSYRIDVRLLLPHIDDIDTRSVATACLTAAPENNNHGFVVLSANNPLARCPASNVRQSGNLLKFDIVCPGHNQAQARANFQLAADRFQANIEMKMGGKNMTMTETQIGRRVGACAPAQK